MPLVLWSVQASRGFDITLTAADPEVEVDDVIAYLTIESVVDPDTAITAPLTSEQGDRVIGAIKRAQRTTA